MYRGDALFWGGSLRPPRPEGPFGVYNLGERQSGDELRDTYQTHFGPNS